MLLFFMKNKDTKESFTFKSYASKTNLLSLDNYLKLKDHELYLNRLIALNNMGHEKKI